MYISPSSNNAFYEYFQDDDSYILPVLLRFDGQPEIDDEVWFLCLDGHKRSFTLCILLFI